jgi:pilus assembly protein CpaF
MASSVARWDDEAQPLQPLRPPPAAAGDQGRGAHWPGDPAGAERIIEDEVRELVRRSAMDPVGDTVAAVRSLIDDVVADYAERTLTASMPALVEPAAVAKAVADRVIGLGPLQEYFDDPEVEEIWINQPDKVFVARAGRPILTGTVLSEEQVHDLVELMLRASGRRVDLSTPFVDASLSDGSRLHVVIPDVTRRHWAVNIRKFVLRASSLDELVRLGTMTPQCARFLEAAVVAGVNLVAAGATQAGKTTLLNCLASAIPARERLVTCEEVFELRIDLPDVVAMQTRQPNLEGQGEIRQRWLVKEALRMRPNRLIVGEVRQEEALDLLIALNSGIAGMTSLHANSAREALDKLTTLPLLAGQNISHGFIVPSVAAAIDLIVFMRCNGDGRRRVEEVLAVPGRVAAGEIESQSLFCQVAGELLWTGHYPPHEERFLAAGIDLGEVLCA